MHVDAYVECHEDRGSNPLASTCGRIYHLPAGLSALEVPESSALATEIVDPLADTRKLNDIKLPENVNMLHIGSLSLLVMIIKET